MSGRRLAQRLALGLVLLGFALPRVAAAANQAAPASPAAAPSCAGAVAPAASAIATPVGESGITKELAAVVDAMFACWNTGDWREYGALLTPELSIARFGSASPDDIANRLEALASRRLLGPISVDAAQYGRLVSDTAASIQVAWREGFARHHESWSFVRANQGWRLYAVTPLDIVMDGPAVGIRVELTDSGIAIPVTGIAQTTLTVLQGINDTGGPFVMTVFALPTGAEPAAIVAGTPAAVFAGSVPIESESSRELVLENLPPGTYVIAIGLETAIAASDPSSMHWVRLTVTAGDGE